MVEFHFIDRKLKILKSKPSVDNVLALQFKVNKIVF